MECASLYIFVQYCVIELCSAWANELLMMSLQVESHKYARGVQWLKDVLFNVQFTKERLLVVANKMINDVSR